MHTNHTHIAHTLYIHACAYVSVFTQVKGARVLVSFDDWNDKYNEWLDMASPKIMPLGMHTDNLVKDKGLDDDDDDLSNSAFFDDNVMIGPKRKSSDNESIYGLEA